MKRIYVYHIAANYRSCTVWEASKITKARCATHTRTPDKGTSRADRCAIIGEWLWSNFLIPSPVYR